LKGTCIKVYSEEHLQLISPALLRRGVNSIRPFDARPDEYPLFLKIMDDSSVLVSADNHDRWPTITTEELLEAQLNVLHFREWSYGVSNKEWYQRDGDDLVPRRVVPFTVKSQFHRNGVPIVDYLRGRWYRILSPDPVINYHLIDDVVVWADGSLSFNGLPASEAAKAWGLYIGSVRVEPFGEVE
jgi:hypothetical protein